MSPQSQIIHNILRNAYPAAVPCSHKGSQRVTNSHKVTPGPSPSASCGSQTLTQSHQAQAPACFCRSQTITKLHQAPAPAHLVDHKKSQSRTRPQRRAILWVPDSHKVAPGPSACASCGSQTVTKSHESGKGKFRRKGLA